MGSSEREGPWIRTVAPVDATGLLREAYGWQGERLPGGEPTEFTQLGSLYPEIVMERLWLYRAVEHCPSQLHAVERQLAALVTSVLNATPHCASGLRVKLAELGVDDAAVAAVLADPRRPATGDERLDAILAYAATLTAAPGDVGAADIARLRAAGLDDLDVLDLNNIVAYYCYINRVARGLGLDTEIPAPHALTALPLGAAPGNA